MSCYIWPQCFPSGSSPFADLPTLERALVQPQLDQHPLIQKSKIQRQAFATPSIQIPKTFPSPTLPATPPRRGLGQVLAPATSSATGTHFQVPLHSGGQLQRSPGATGGPGLNSKDSWSCTLWGEADPSSRLLEASPLSHLRKHLTQA